MRQLLRRHVIGVGFDGEFNVPCEAKWRAGGYELDQLGIGEQDRGPAAQIEGVKRGEATCIKAGFRINTR